MKQIKWDEVPDDVLKSVYDKWFGISIKGRWGDRDWNPCAMCFWLDRKFEAGKKCTKCPLHKEGWCRIGHSRLHYKNHKDEDEWLMDVNRFVKMLRRRLRKRGCDV